MIHGFRRGSKQDDESAAAQVSANDAFDLAIQFEQRDDLPAAEQAYRTADELGHAIAAVNLGVLLEERDDVAGAEQAFRRADERGDATGAFHLAWLLQEGGDLVGAEQAYRRADLRGHPAAGANLRMLHGGPRIGGDAPGVPEPPLATPPPGDAAEPAPAGPPAADAQTAQPAPAPPSEPPAGTIDASVATATDVTTAVAAASAMGGEAPLVDQVSPDLISELNQATRTTRRGQPAPRSPAPKRATPRSGPAPPGRRARPVPAPRRDAPSRNTPKGGDEKPQRSRSRPRRVIGWLVPVIAFGAAFLAGAATKPHAPAPAQLAPAASLGRSTVSISSLKALPRPAALGRSRPGHRAKPKTTVHSPVSVGPAAPAAPVPGAPARVAPPSSTTSGGRTSTTTHGSGGTSVSTTSSANGTGTSSGSG